MPISHDEVEKNQWKVINSLAAKVEGLSSAVDVSNDILIKQMEQNAEEHKAAIAELRTMHDSYVTMTKYIIGLLAIIIFSLIGAIIYGAIGKQGLFAVRDSMPKMAIAPMHNDFDKYTFFRRLKTAA